jgi:hypothetical protein
MNSIGLTGCHAAFAVPDIKTARTKLTAANFGFRDI